MPATFDDPIAKYCRRFGIPESQLFVHVEADGPGSMGYRVSPAGDMIVRDLTGRRLVRPVGRERARQKVIHYQTRLDHATATFFGVKNALTDPRKSSFLWPADWYGPALGPLEDLRYLRGLVKTLRAALAEAQTEFDLSPEEVAKAQAQAAREAAQRQADDARAELAAKVRAISLDSDEEDGPDLRPR